MYDTKLVNAAQQGDEAAFAALYDRNAEGVYDLCYALVGDEQEASRLTTLVFTLAARHLADITDASQVRPWLLAITRDRVLAEDEAGTLRSAWGAEAPVVAEGGLSVEPLGTNELRRWVREAAATLALADQVVVELGTRYDLDADQLTAAIGCPPLRLDAIVAQVEQEADQVIGSLILARQGRKDCKRLAGLLEHWDGRPSVEIADVADRHAATCERCRRRRALVSPLELLAAAPVVAAPAELRGQALEVAAAELPRPDGAVGAGGGAAAGGAAGGVAGGAALAGAAGSAGMAGSAARGGAGSGGGRGRAGAEAGWAGSEGGEGAWSAGAAAGAAAGAGAAGAGAAGAGAVGAAWGDDTVAVPASPPAGAGRGGPRHIRSARPWGLIAAVAAAVIVLIVALVLVLRPSSSPTKVATAPPPTTAAIAPGTTTVSTVAAVAPVTIAPIASTTIASTVPPAVGSRLALNTTSVDFGADATSAQVVLSDTGAGQAGWHVASPAPWLTVTPSSGFLQSSGQVQVTLTLNRQKAPNGPFHVSLTFAPSDTTGTSTSLAVVGTNTVPTTTTSVAITTSTTPTSASTTTTSAGSGPVISGVSASPTSIKTTPCSPDQSVVSATVTDPAGVTSVTVDYTLPGGGPHVATMTLSGSTWSAAIGAAPAAGTITYTVHATGADGHSSTSPSGTVTVASSAL